MKYYTKKEIGRLGIKRPNDIKQIKKIPYGNRYLYLIDSVDKYGRSIIDVNEYDRRKRHVMSGKDSFDMTEWIPTGEIYKYFPLGSQKLSKLSKRPDCSRFKFNGLWLYQKSWVKKVLREFSEQIKRENLYFTTKYDKTFESWQTAVEKW